MIEKILERLEETDINDIQMVVSETLVKYGFPRESVVQDEIWDALDGLSTNKFAIQIVQEVAKDGGWIPVETELPKEEGMYLCTVFHANKYVPWIMRFKNGEFVRPDDVEDLDYEVLAWQRIAPYQKGE